MQSSPPPFQQEAPRANKKGNVTLWVTVTAIFLVIAMCGGLIYGIYRLVTRVGGMISTYAQCPITVGFVDRAIRDYAKEHDGALPKADAWQKDIAPYYARYAKTIDDKLKNSPFVKIKASDISQPLSCAMGEPVTAIYYNTEVSGVKIADVKNPDQTVLIYEKFDAPKLNAHAPYQVQDRRVMVMDEKRAPLVRHVAGDSDYLQTKDKGFRIDVNDGPSEKAQPAGGAQPGH